MTRKIGDGLGDGGRDPDLPRSPQNRGICLKNLHISALASAHATKRGILYNYTIKSLRLLFFDFLKFPGVAEYAE